jgi:hypothetical protein
MELFAHGGITPEIRRTFLVYLASHNRTIHEVLFPTPKDIQLAPARSASQSFFNRTLRNSTL